jgi:DNA-binding beta-propeller fold protein YncE
MQMLFGSGEYTYELVEGWAQLPSGYSFPDVGGLAVDASDRLFVFNRSPHPVMIFDRKGDFVASWGEGIFSRPHGIRTTGDGFVWCTDDLNHTVRKFTLQGDLKMTIGTMNTPSDTGYVEQSDLAASLDTIRRGGPPFNRPTGVALSSAGDIFVTDGYGNARVHRFGHDGRLRLSWGEPGTGTSQFRLPHNVWVDRQDRVWVPDRENSRIQIFDVAGEFLAQWTDVVRPSDVFIDGNDIVYVSEIGHVGAAGPRISLFTTSGKVLTRWGCPAGDHHTDLFVSPHAIAVDSRGDVYVGEVAMTHAGFDRGSRVVQKFARR